MTNRRKGNAYGIKRTGFDLTFIFWSRRVARPFCVFCLTTGWKYSIIENMNQKSRKIFNFSLDKGGDSGIFPRKEPPRRGCFPFGMGVERRRYVSLARSGGGRKRHANPPMGVDGVPKITRRGSFSGWSRRVSGWAEGLPKTPLRGRGLPYPSKGG